jgi:hypothetical protein
VCLFQDSQSSQELAASQNSTSDETSSSQELSQDFPSLVPETRKTNKRFEPENKTAVHIVGTVGQGKRNPIASNSSTVTLKNTSRNTSDSPDKISENNNSNSGVKTSNNSNSSNEASQHINSTGSKKCGE